MTEPPAAALLAGFRVAQLGGGMGAAVCGRLLADLGAVVSCVDPDMSTPLSEYLNFGKAVADVDRALPSADLVVCEGAPKDLRARHCDATTLRRINPRAALVCISPYGQTG